MRTFSICLLIALAIAVCACSGSDAKEPAPQPPSNLALSLDVGSPNDQGVVPLQLTLTNPGDKTVRVTLTGTRDNGFFGSFSFSARDSSDIEVWNWRIGKVAQAIASDLGIGPGEKRTFAGEWDRRDNQGEVVPPGTYLVSGTFEGETYYSNVRFELTTEPQKFEVP